MAQPVTPTLVLKRFFLWLLICSVSAAPSFVLADSEHANRAGMAAEVMLFVLGYTWWTSTPRFQHFYERRGIRPTLRFGYGLRLLLSVLLALQVFSNDGGSPFLMVDFFFGIISVHLGATLVDQASGAAMRSFHGALLITCIQGALLNLAIFIVMVLYYGAMGYARSEPRHERQRGFEVITPVATPVEPTASSKELNSDMSQAP